MERTLFIIDPDGNETEINTRYLYGNPKRNKEIIKISYINEIYFSVFTYYFKFQLCYS